MKQGRAYISYVCLNTQKILLEDVKYGEQKTVTTYKEQRLLVKMTSLTTYQNALFRKSRDKSVRRKTMLSRHTHRARACYWIFNMRFIQRFRKIISLYFIIFSNTLSIKFTPLITHVSANMYVYMCLLVLICSHTHIQPKSQPMSWVLHSYLMGLFILLQFYFTKISFKITFRLNEVYFMLN